LFNSGYDANSGFFASLPQRGDTVVFDEHVHASVREGLKLSRAKTCVSFKHNDVKDLKRVLEGVRECGRNVFVAVESLYSMDGDLAPLREIVEVVERIEGGNGYVVVDEAHSNGVYGERGRGVVCSLGLEGRVFARLHTFGKGLACNGGICIFTLFPKVLLFCSQLLTLDYKLPFFAPS
jgi:8-amino-7-oxononanoate synthase